MTTLTPVTLRFLRRLCDQVTLRAGDANFEADAHALIAAMRELDVAIAAISQNGQSEALEHYPEGSRS
jgi:hypothetical protein